MLTSTASSQSRWPAWVNVSTDTVYCFTADQTRELWRVYDERDMFRELHDSANVVIGQMDIIINTQENMIDSYERTIKNDSLIRKQDEILYSSLEKKYRKQKVTTRVFQGSTLLFFLLLIL